MARRARIPHSLLVLGVTVSLGTLLPPVASAASTTLVASGKDNAPPNALAIIIALAVLLGVSFIALVVISVLYALECLQRGSLAKQLAAVQQSRGNENRGRLVSEAAPTGTQPNTLSYYADDMDTTNHEQLWRDQDKWARARQRETSEKRAERALQQYEMQEERIDRMREQRARRLMRQEQQQTYNYQQPSRPPSTMAYYAYAAGD